jgi:hypothetical protein
MPGSADYFMNDNIRNAPIISALVISMKNAATSVP